MFAIVGSLGTEAQRGDPALPEPEQGAAGPHRDRRLDVGRGLREVPVDGRLAARLRVRGQALRPGDRAQQPEREDRGAATRTTASGRTTSRGLKRGLGAKAVNIVGEERVRGDGDRRARRRWRSSAATGATDARHLRDAAATRSRRTSIANALALAPAVDLHDARSPRRTCSSRWRRRPAPATFVEQDVHRRST